MRRPAIKLLLWLLVLLALPVAALTGQELFWETPRVLEAQGVRFSQAAEGGGLIAVAWQELVARAKGQGDIYVRLETSRDGIEWSKSVRVFGPVAYSNPEPDLQPPVYSLAVDGRGRILLAVAVADKATAILSSEDGGRSFAQLARLESSSTAVTPNLFVTSRGGYLLFLTQSVRRAAPAGKIEEQGLSLYFSRSDDGRRWTVLAPFLPQGELRYSFLPQHAALKGKDFLVFQGRGGSETYQLYLAASADGGSSWGAAAPITTADSFGEVVQGQAHPPLDFTNQRPQISALGDSLGLVWERNIFGMRAQIYYCELDERGNVTTPRERVTTAGESIYGQVIPFRGGTYVLYADTSLAASRITLALKRGIWDATVLSRPLAGISSNPHAVLYKDRLLIFWETDRGLVALRPVSGVPAPELIATDFTPGQRSNRSSVAVKWKDPPDPAGIREYAYTWSVNGTPKLQRTISQSNPTVVLPAEEDGTWELSVVATDFAGNRSAPARIAFVRDATPPPSVRVEPLPTDDAGFLVSNTFTINWTLKTEKAIAGFTYQARYIGGSEGEARSALAGLPLPPGKVITTATSVSFNNEDNGFYAFTVAPIDTTGNVGEPTRVVYKLDKFKPFTGVFRVERKADLLGNVTLTIVGRGFDTDGKVEEITLGSTTAPPYDYTFSRAKGDFTVVDDRHIQGPILNAELKSGRYLLGLLHATRGRTFWRDGVIAFETPGTIKIGDFRIRYLPGWATGRVPRFTVPTAELVVVAVVVLLAGLIILSARTMVSLAREGAMLREEVTALIEGRPSAGWVERKTAMRKLERRGAGLRLKYTLLMVVLVFLIVLIVAIPLSFQMIGRQRQTLAAGLQDRAGILIGSIASAAEIQLRRGDQGYADIADAPNAFKTMPEATYATVTGPGNAAKGADPASFDYVWASAEKKWVDQYQAGQFRVAEEKEQDLLSAEVLPGFRREVEDEARKRVGAQGDQVLGFLTRYVELSTKTDRRSQEEATAALNSYAKGQKTIDASLKTLSPTFIRSFPAFDANAAALAPAYTFYMPVVYMSSKKDASGAPARDASGSYQVAYYQGLVRLAVSTDRITAQITSARASLITITGIIALAAIGLGVLGAIILASITVNPIKKLADHVAIIRDTVNKKDLEGKSIAIRTRDEIGQLADTVNDMTHGLVEAAKADEELKIGKNIQKMFLPLSKVGKEKGSTGGLDDKSVELFGYYEGAKGVSGDFFDFTALDETHYSLIKCDVSGKGVSASLIMVEVATLYLSFVSVWKKGKKEPLADLVYRINDMLEERQFEGRFAALMICLFDTRTNIATLCHAGDNKVHLYEAERRETIQTVLNEAPATGMFPRFMFADKTPYREVPQRLDPGDALFLFTDGFEESNRALRTEDFQLVYQEGDAHPREGSDGRKRKPETEEFGISRIHSISDAVFNRSTFRLERAKNPIPGEDLVFDFSECAGTAREAVLALVAVEKVFRLIRHPEAGTQNKVKVDLQVDAFLKKHFRQYVAYFGHPLEAKPGEQSMEFTHLMEDEQFDDLTLLVMRRK